MLGAYGHLAMNFFIMPMFIITLAYVCKVPSEKLETFTPIGRLLTKNQSLDMWQVGRGAVTEDRLLHVCEASALSQHFKMKIV